MPHLSGIVAGSGEDPGAVVVADNLGGALIEDGGGTSSTGVSAAPTGHHAVGTRIHSSNTLGGQVHGFDTGVGVQVQGTAQLQKSDVVAVDVSDLRIVAGMDQNSGDPTSLTGACKSRGHSCETNSAPLRATYWVFY